MKVGYLSVALLCAFSGVSLAQDSSCDKVLDLGFNAFDLYSEKEINETYYQMLSMSEEELDKLADSYEKKENLGITSKLLAIAWSRNRDEKKFRERFKASKFKYNAGLSIDNSYFEYLKTRTVNKDTLEAWRACKSEEILAKKKMKELEIKSGGFIPEIVGDEAGVFTFVINKIPEEGHPDKVKIVNVAKTNIEFIGDFKLKADSYVENYTGISQSMRLIDPSVEASLVVSLDNYSPVTYNFNKNALSNFPLGSLITSILDFNQFSFETKNNQDSVFDPKESKWAPADGRDVSGSDYSKYNNHVPDMRGQFTRGANIIYSTNEPTKYINGKDDDVRKVVQKYSYQGQGTKLPSRPFTGGTNNTGAHSHSYRAIHMGGSPWGDRHDNDATQTVDGSPRTSTDGAHQHSATINGGGDVETRPKNIAVYYYIRINK